jgi:hypothetical protein
MLNLNLGVSSRLLVITSEGSGKDGTMIRGWTGIDWRASKSTRGTSPIGRRVTLLIYKIQLKGIHQRQSSTGIAFSLPVCTTNTDPDHLRQKQRSSRLVLYGDTKAHRPRDVGGGGTMPQKRQRGRDSSLESLGLLEAHCETAWSKFLLCNSTPASRRRGLRGHRETLRPAVRGLRTHSVENTKQAHDS